MGTTMTNMLIAMIIKIEMIILLKLIINVQSMYVQ